MLANPIAPFPPRVVSKPTGGFRPIGVLQICMAWWAYRTGVLPRYLDFRVYLALHEVAERRLAASRVRKRKVPGTLIPVPPRQELVAELRALVGGNSDRLVREALSRLESTGLVMASGSFLALSDGSEALAKAPAALLSMLNKLSLTAMNTGRRLAVPRPVLRVLARSATPSLAATVFGYLIQCVWWRDNVLHVHGSCTAAFVSKRFGVDPRSVKRARSELRRIGWLVPAGTRRLEAEGDTLPNLLWSGIPEKCGSTQAAPRTCLSPLPPKRDTKMSPHTTCTQLRSGSKYQQPGSRPLAGIQGGMGEVPRPCLSNVRLMDLSSVERMNALFEEATATGRLTLSPADRLRFFAVAARALRLGSRNPCGFFAAVVRRNLWHVISQADEDRAIHRLRDDENDAMSQGAVPKQPRGVSSLVVHQKVPGEAGVPRIQSLVASLVVRCSMEKGIKLDREFQHDHSPGFAPAARDPVGPRSKGPSEAAGRGASGRDAGRPADGLPEA